MSLARYVTRPSKGRTSKGLDNNTSTSVALGYGAVQDAEGDTRQTLEQFGALNGERQRAGLSLLGPAPFKIYRETVATDIGAEDVTQRRRAANLPVPNRNSA